MREEKFITDDDVLLSIITLVDAGSAKNVSLLFAGQSYLNKANLPTRDGDPPNTPMHPVRTSLGDIEVAEAPGAQRRVPEFCCLVTRSL